MDQESDPLFSLIDAKDGDRGRFSELSLTLRLKNKLIFMQIHENTFKTRIIDYLHESLHTGQHHGLKSTLMSKITLN